MHWAKEPQSEVIEACARVVREVTGDRRKNFLNSFATKGTSGVSDFSVWHETQTSDFALV